MKRVFNYFLPIDDASVQIDDHKSKFLVSVLIFICLSALPYIPLYNYLGFYEAVYVVTFIILVCFIDLFIFKWTKNFNLSVSIFAGACSFFFVFLLYYTNGIKSPFIIWIGIVPVVSILLGSRKILIFLTIISVLILSAFWYLDFFDYIIINRLATKWYGMLIGFNIIGMAAMLLFVTMRYDSDNRNITTKLKESNKELERFAYIASHDMKEPLRNIVSFSQLLKRKLSGKMNEDESEYLEFVTKNAKQMNELIKGILEFSKIDKTEEEKLAEVNLNAVMQEVVLNLDTIAKDKNAKINFQKLPIIYGNEIQLVSLFQNLIENGIKYNNKEIPKIELSIQEAENAYNIFIKDNGIGINEEYHNKIFEMFKRLHTRNEYQGTGIGLALCKKIAQRHNGDLNVYNSDNQGTTFLLTLPTEQLN